jgi:hypothetical protein
MQAQAAPTSFLKLPNDSLLDIISVYLYSTARISMLSFVEGSRLDVADWQLLKVVIGGSAAIIPGICCVKTRRKQLLLTAPGPEA